ncbi:Na+/H+ antiporter subunit E [Candidatus Altiarchaeota archaeon]
MVIKRIVYAVRYAACLAYNILKSTLSVTLLCITGGIDPKVVEIKSRLTRPVSLFLLANSITLTPGTLTIDVDTDTQTLRVAVLTPRAKADVIPFERYIKGALE